MKTTSMIWKIAVAVFLISGVLLSIQGYALFTNNAPKKQSLGSNVIEVRMRVIKNEWRWDPKEITIPANSIARLRIFNEDTYEHGFAIKELGIDKKIPPQRETVIELTNIKPGEYDFLCSILCGKGHFEQKGILTVR